MESLLFSALYALVILVSVVKLDNTYYNLAEAPQLFQKFMQDYHKVYNNPQDMAIRYVNFVQNLKELNQMNANYPYTSFGINSFADETAEETLAKHTAPVPYPSDNNLIHKNNYFVPYHDAYNGYK